MTRRPDDTSCPVCGMPSVPIIYGLPLSDLFDAEERGEVVLGGCIVGDDDPTHQCTAGHRWSGRP